MEMQTNTEYDKIVGTIMQNVLNQSAYTNGKIVLWDFQQHQATDQLYYNVACIAADLFDLQMYVQMPFFSYIPFKFKRRKRKNLHWVSRNADWVGADGRTSIYIIMHHVKEYYGITMDKFKDINDEYYGWIE